MFYNPYIIDVTFDYFVDDGSNILYKDPDLHTEAGNRLTLDLNEYISVEFEDLIKGSLLTV